MNERMWLFFALSAIAAANATLAYRCAQRGDTAKTVLYSAILIVASIAMHP